MPRKSPFPGLDPYLERNWGDVHSSLVLYTRDAIQQHLPDDLRSRVEERVYLEDGDTQRQIIPDVHIAEITPWSLGPVFVPGGQGSAAGVAEPLVVGRVDPVTETFVEIRERGGGRLVTVIEFLSPANKVTGLGRDKYLEKQDQIRRSNASLVEIDFVRDGRYALAADRDLVPDAYLREPLGCISLGWRHGRQELYTMPLRKRLPVLPIPLRSHEPRLALDLQALHDQAWRAGRYDDTDYSVAPVPPLPPEHEQWAREMAAGAAD